MYLCPPKEFAGENQFELYQQFKSEQVFLQGSPNFINYAKY